MFRLRVACWTAYFTLSFDVENLLLEITYNYGTYQGIYISTA